MEGNSKEETERNKNTYFIIMRTNLPKCDLKFWSKKAKNWYTSTHRIIFYLNKQTKKKENVSKDTDQINWWKTVPHIIEKENIPNVKRTPKNQKDLYMAEELAKGTNNPSH